MSARPEFASTTSVTCLLNPQRRAAGQIQSAPLATKGQPLHSLRNLCAKALLYRRGRVKVGQKIGASSNLGGKLLLKSGACA
jgi:hypothetical protein